MTLSMDWRRSRKLRECVNCRAFIYEGTRYMSMFGFTEDERIPYRISLCESCGCSQERQLNYAYINRVYDVRAVVGHRVAVDGRLGTILQPMHATPYVHVRFDGEKRTTYCHPKWMIEYLGAVAA